MAKTTYVQLEDENRVLKDEIEILQDRLDAIGGLSDYAVEDAEEEDFDDLDEDLD